MTPTGQLTLLYVFTTKPGTGFYPNGYYPTSITEGSDGLLYGTNTWTVAPLPLVPEPSGAYNKDGSGFQKLEQFCTSCAYGSYPNQIIAASDGNLYGTTGYGGIFTGSASTNLGCGLVFKLTTV